MTANTVGCQQTRGSGSTQVSRFTRFLIATLLLLGGLCGQAFAQTCDFVAISPTTATGATNGSVGFILQGQTACSPTITGTLAITADTTGGASIVPPTTFTATLDTDYNFSVNLGPTAGGSGTVLATCTSGGCTGDTLTFTFATFNNHTYVMTSPAATTINVQTSTTLSANLLTNGLPGTYQTNFTNITTSTNLGNTAPDGAGNTSMLFSSAIAGTYTIRATVVCPVAAPDPSCPPIPPLNFVVTVENSGMSTVSPAAVSTPGALTVNLTAHQGGATVPAPNGSVINWSITQPAGGDGVLGSPTSTTTGGDATNTFIATVPGVYTVTAMTFCTFCSPNTATFTITVTAIVRTLTIVSGDNQTGAPGATLPAPLTVEARNNGTVVGGVGIAYTFASGTGTLAPATPTTSGTGIASSSLTLSATPGTVTVRAERVDDPTVFVTFTTNAARLRTLPTLTPAGRAVAGAIDDFCPRLGTGPTTDPGLADLRARCNELIGSINTDPAGVAAALEELYADVALVQSKSGLLAAQAQFDNIKVRIAALRSGTKGISFGGLALNNGRGTAPIGSFVESLLQDGNSGETGADFGRWGFFAAGTIGRGDADAGVVDPAYDFDIKGLTVGADYRYSDKLIFGATLGYTRQGNDLKGAEGNLDTTGWSVSGYSTYYQANSWYTDAVLSYGHNKFDMLRRLHYAFSLPGGGTTVVDQLATANSGGDSLTFAGSFGRDFNKGAWGFGPYARLMYTKLSFDSMTEHYATGVPGSGWALVIDTQDVTSISSVIGGKMTFTHSASWGVLIPHLQLEWQHEFKDDPSAVEAHFLHDPFAVPFTIEGDPIDTDFYRLGVGLSLVMTHGRSGFFFYEKLIGRDGVSQDNLALGLRIEF
ncbi:autotransporter domain-containing protein [Arenimonas oryziterrae]|uniref:Autotransporter domain-containing protein n=1 Tax=Arenimonas oryziterrae DSM 21050 = YC6267 TaxID=1121015 RepID=A0A091APF6_9GAMM|nr:autotransporter domain-containing protein [Arenimonas oryziterrae]KFN41266.1 hypothetical protein N789_05095 [Arenimonas oryziterrae DSM 21050 = YC6267]